MTAQRTLILGVGNPLLADDGVGVHVVHRLAERELPPGVELADAGTSGLGILDLIEGYDQVVIIDAIDIGTEPGRVLVLDLEDLRRSTPLHLVSPHDADLLTALETGRRVGLRLPAEIRIVAVQIADATTFSETCTPAVAAAVEQVCDTALDLAGADSG